MEHAQPDAVLVETVAQAISAKLATTDKLVVAGIGGAQGSGKSTLAAALVRRFEDQGVATAALSLDDLYLTRAERAQLARDVHPLFATRGPPGTHDVELGMGVLAALAAGEPARLPRFDKGRDDRVPQESWPSAPPHLRLLVLEGWCLGAAPEPPHALVEPLNALERCEDAHATWRRCVNDALAGDYQRLFARIDLLTFLAAPNFGVVERWRGEQEADLLRRDPASPRAMNEAALARFVQHYERLTRHMLRAMPGHADIVAWLDEDRGVERIVTRADRS